MFEKQIMAAIGPGIKEAMTFFVKKSNEVAENTNMLRILPEILEELKENNRLVIDTLEELKKLNKSKGGVKC